MARSWMTRPLICATLVCALAGLSGAARGADDPLVKTFATESGAKTPLKIILQPGPTDGTYKGTIERGDDSFAFVAQRDANEPGKITGTFDSADQHFPFDAVLANGQLALTTGKKTFMLSPAATTQQADTAILHRQKIHDEVTDMDAVSALIPDGWKLNGKVIWVGRGAGLTIYSIDVADPQTQAGETSYPDLTFVDGKKEMNERMWPGQDQYWEKQCAQGNLDILGCEFQPLVVSPLDYFKRFVLPRFRTDLQQATDLKILSVKDLPPEYLKALAASTGNPSLQVAGSRIRIQYTVDTTLMEEEFTCMLLHCQIGQGTLAYTEWVGTVYSCRAPSGKLDAMLATLVAIHDSQREELPFFNRKMQIIQMLIDASQKQLEEINSSAQKRMAAMHDYFTRSNEEVSAKIHRNFEDQQAAKSQAQKQEINYINDMQDFSNPGGGTLTLPDNYKYYYGDGNNVACTNDPMYQPPVGYQKLDRAP